MGTAVEWYHCLIKQYLPAGKAMYRLMVVVDPVCSSVLLSLFAKENCTVVGAPTSADEKVATHPPTGRYVCILMRAHSTYVRPTALKKRPHREKQKSHYNSFVRVRALISE